MFSSHSALLGRDKLKAPTPHPLISATRGIHFFLVSAAQKVKFLAPGRKEYADYKLNSGSRTTTTIAHTLHIQTPPYTPQQPPSRRTISQNVPFSSKLESHTSCTFTDSKPWYSSHRSRSFFLSRKTTVLAHNSRDSTPKVNRQTEVACQASVQAGLQIALSSMSAYTDLALHRVIRAHEGHAFTLGPKCDFANFRKVSSGLQGRFRRGVSRSTLSRGSTSTAAHPLRCHGYSTAPWSRNNG